MNIHLEDLKKVIDVAVQRGLFVNAESVVNTLKSFREVEYMVETYEQKMKRSNGGEPAPDNSERT